MILEDFHHLTDSILNILTIIAGMLGGVWVYAKYVVERGFVPASQLDVERHRLGLLGKGAIFDIAIHIANVGSSTLIARNIMLDVRYLKRDDEISFLNRMETPGRLLFPHSLKNDLLRSLDERSGAEKVSRSRGLPVVPYDTFVQPGVDQRYGFTTILPANAKCILIYVSFEYAQKPWRFQLVVYKISRMIGLSSYSLHHIYRDHNVERIFWLD